MKPGKPMKRLVPLRSRPQGPVEGPQAERCRGLPCLVCGAAPPSDPAHVTTRGAGGGDRYNVVPLCREHHDEQHRNGIANFQEQHGVDLVLAAWKIGKDMGGEA